MAHALANAPPVSETALFIVKPMQLGAILAVMDIEAEISFPTPWPAQAYEYELQRNPNSYFVIACLAPCAACAATARRVSFWQRLIGRRDVRSAIRTATKNSRPKQPFSASHRIHRGAIFFTPAWRSKACADQHLDRRSGPGFGRRNGPAFGAPRPRKTMPAPLASIRRPAHRFPPRQGAERGRFRPGDLKAGERLVRLAANASTTRGLPPSR